MLLRRIGEYRECITRVSLLLPALAVLYACTTDPHMRNWQALGMGSPTRVITTDNYQPVKVVTGVADSSSLPTGEPLGDESAAKLISIAEDTNSLALVVVQDGKVIFQHYSHGVGPRTRIDSYNFHKTLLTIVFGHAVERGLVSLDRPAADFIPSWAKDKRREITVRHLLNHESGLLSVAARLEPYDPIMKLFVGLDLQRQVDDAKTFVSPGQQFDFTHMNAQALYSILRRATGKPYEETIADYLWKPLGAAPASVSYDRPGGDARAMCCFIAEIDSWLRIGTMLSARGKFEGRQVVSSAWIDAMLAPSATNPNFGFNLWITSPFTGERLQSVQKKLKRPITGPFLIDDLYFMEASGNGRIYFAPSHRLTIFRIGVFDGAFAPWDDALLVNAVVEGLDRKSVGDGS